MSWFFAGPTSATGIGSPHRRARRLSMHLLSSAILSGGSIIDLDYTFFVQLGVFAIAFFALKALVFKPMVAIFEARDEAIQGARAEAKAMQLEAAGADQRFDKKMHEARAVAGAEREKLRAEGQRLEREILDAARAATGKQLSDADEKLQAEAVQVRRDIEARVPELSRQVAAKLLQREVAP